MVRGWKNFESHDSKSLGCFEKTNGRSVDIKGDSGEIQKEVKRVNGESFYCLGEDKYHC